MKRVHVWISGRVQGVAFRYRTQSQAEGLGLKGWVRNLSDGRVEALFEGDDSDVNSMLAWCRKGPSLARVDDLEISEELYKGEFRDFRITY